MRSVEFDVVVTGSGSAGLTAAVVCAKLGLKVALVEKAATFGGTSAWSGGGCWVPVNPLAAGVGVEDNVDAADRYVTSIVGQYLRRDLLDAFLKHSNAMLAFLLKNTEVRFMARSPAPDWRMDVDGSRIGGRSLASPYYDGRLLGADMLKRLERPLDSFNAPMGMMMSPLDFMHALKMFRSWASCRHMVGVIGRYAVDVLRFGRGTRLTMGNALIARLLKSAMDAGVTLWSSTPALALQSDAGRITGVRVRRDDEELLLNVRGGVILASGGFAASAALCKQYYPPQIDHHSMVNSNNVGDGMRMAQVVGAQIDTRDAQPAAWAVVSKRKGGDGPRSGCLHHFTDLPKPGNIVVNDQAQRFANEANLQLGKSMLACGVHTAWILCDHRAIRKYGVGLVWPYAINLGSLERNGYVTSAPSIRQLAERIGLDPATLEATVARFNTNAASGVDPDFRRGELALDRAMGDPSHSPNPCLRPLESGPFHAVRIFLGDAGSVVGLKVDARARVLDGNDSPIRGLYACGLDMNSIWAGTGIANGMNHSHNMTFAYLASQDLAGSISNDSAGVDNERIAATI